MSPSIGSWGLSCRLAFPCIAGKIGSDLFFFYFFYLEAQDGLALALKRKPVEVGVLSVLVTVRHTALFRPRYVTYMVLQGWGGAFLIYSYYFNGYWRLTDFWHLAGAEVGFEAGSGFDPHPASFAP